MTKLLDVVIPNSLLTLLGIIAEPGQAESFGGDAKRKERTFKALNFFIKTFLFC